MSTSPITSAGLPLSQAIGAAFAGPRYIIGPAYYAEAAKAAQGGATARTEAAPDPAARAGAERVATVAREQDRVELASVSHRVNAGPLAPGGTPSNTPATYAPRTGEGRSAPARASTARGVLDVYA